MYIRWIQALLCPNIDSSLRENAKLRREVEGLNSTVLNFINERRSILAERDALYETISLKDKRMDELEAEMEVIRGEKQYIDTLETQWNAKYPVNVVTWPCRYAVGSTGITFRTDVRWFFINPLCDELQQVIRQCKESTDDGKAVWAQKWVKKNITYVSDIEKYKLIEYWADPVETLRNRCGDCDDGAILMANLMNALGVPYWRHRITAGYVVDGTGKGLHAYVTYLPDFELSKPFEQQNWVVMDWCYYARLTELSKRPNYKDEPKYFTGDVKFSFNRDYAFAKAGTI